MIITRRSFLTGLIAAPLVVRAGVLMPVRPVVETVPAAPFLTEYSWQQLSVGFSIKPPTKLIVCGRYMRQAERLLAQSGNRVWPA